MAMIDGDLTTEKTRVSEGRRAMEQHMHEWQQRYQSEKDENVKLQARIEELGMLRDHQEKSPVNPSDRLFP